MSRIIDWKKPVQILDADEKWQDARLIYTTRQRDYVLSYERSSCAGRELVVQLSFNECGARVRNTPIKRLAFVHLHSNGIAAVPAYGCWGSGDRCPTCLGKGGETFECRKIEWETPAP